ncbi:MAG: hypothetical protein ACE5JG_11555, partial [Planctomycetota bacterium]
MSRSVVALLVVHAALGSSVRAPDLVRALGSHDPAQRRAAYEALVRIGPAAVPALVRGLEDGDPEIARTSRSLLLRFPRETARLLELRPPTARTAALLDELHARRYVRVCLLVYGPDLPDIYRGEILLAASASEELRTAAPSGPGPKATVTAFAAEGRSARDAAPVRKVSVRMRGWDDGDHVVPQADRAELRYLRGISRRRAFCLSLVQRCSILQYPARPAQTRRKIEEALAGAVAAGGLYEAAEAYWEATRSRDFAGSLRERFRGDVPARAAGLLARAGDTAARRLVLQVVAGERPVGEAARRDALRAAAALNGRDVVAAIRKAALAAAHPDFLPVLVRRLAALEGGGGAALEIFRSGPADLRP